MRTRGGKAACQKHFYAPLGLPRLQRLPVLVNVCLLEVECAASQLAVVDFVIDAFAALQFGWKNSRNRPSSHFQRRLPTDSSAEGSGHALAPMDVCFELRGFRRLRQSSLL